MPTDIVVHPLGIAAVRTYLLSRTEVTDLVGTRVGGSMPPSTASPRFPAIRLTELTGAEAIPRVWVRMFFQADCWASDQPAADRLARVVAAVLRGSANYVTTGAVLGETAGISWRTAPDESITPTQPRTIVSGHAWIRPN